MADFHPQETSLPQVGNDEVRNEESLTKRAAYARAMHHRQILRRTIVISIIVGLVAVFGLVALPVVRQITTHWSLGGVGFVVDWQLDGENWISGGVTGVTCKGGGTGLNQPQDIDPYLLLLPRLWNLETLSLNDCELTEKGLAPLARLDQLRELSLSRLNHIRYGGGSLGLSDACLVPVKGLTNLQKLTLSGNRITDSGLAMLAGLSNLEMLDLDATDVTDAGLIHLQALKQLKVLGLAGTKVTPQGVKALQAAMPGLEIDFDMEPYLAEKVREWRRQHP
jgi:Leucine rich repeat/Leucine Rich repeat